MEYETLFDVINDVYFYYRLMRRFSGHDMDVTVHEGLNEFVEGYIADYPMYPDELSLALILPARICNYSSNEYFVSFKQNGIPD